LQKNDAKLLKQRGNKVVQPPMLSGSPPRRDFFQIILLKTKAIYHGHSKEASSPVFLENNHILFYLGLKLQTMVSTFLPHREAKQELFLKVL
jgi:hypothetical protein